LDFLLPPTGISLEFKVLSCFVPLPLDTGPHNLDLEQRERTIYLVSWHISEDEGSLIWKGREVEDESEKVG
jgi:hypothetical protein